MPASLGAEALGKTQPEHVREVGDLLEPLMLKGEEGRVMSSAERNNNQPCSRESGGGGTWPPPTFAPCRAHLQSRPRFTSLAKLRGA